MASYSSADEIKAMTRHLLDDQRDFNGATLPHGDEINVFLTYTDAALNVALASEGFAVPLTNATAKPLLDSWATARGAAWVEATQRGVGYSDEADTRTALFLNKLSGDALKFIKANSKGLEQLGASRTTNTSDGLTFTAIDKRSQRNDPDNTSREQPLFTRRQWDTPGTYRNDDDEDYS